MKPVEVGMNSLLKSHLGTQFMTKVNRAWTKSIANSKKVEMIPMKTVEVAMSSLLKSHLGTQFMTKVNRA
jgi:hypothetical protein